MTNQEAVDERPPILTPRELAGWLRCGKNQAYALLTSGQIRAVRVGNSWRIPRRSVEAFLAGDEQQQAGA